MKICLGISWLCRLALAVVFVAAGIFKLLEPQDFADAVHAFQIVSGVPWLITLIALALPVFEIITGIAILIPRWSLFSSVNLIFLNLGFIGLLIATKVRDISVSCSCFGSFFKTDSLDVVIWRDVVFVLMAGFVVFAALRSHRSLVG